MNKNFLSKKSWHTGSLKHIEKVWLAERRHTDEQKQIDLLKREMAEEQQIYDLKKLHQDSSGSKKVDRLDWMYEGSLSKQATSEDYLLGKKYDVKEEDDLSKISNQAPGSIFISTTNTTQDAATKMRDDPLLAIKKEEQKALTDILHNPMKMKMLEKEKEMQKLLKHLKKKEKKDLKKEKSGKHKRSKSKSRSRSRSPPRESKRHKSDDEKGTNSRDRDVRETNRGDEQRKTDEPRDRDGENGRRKDDRDERRSKDDRRGYDDRRRDNDNRRDNDHIRDRDDRRGEKRDRDETKRDHETRGERKEEPNRNNNYRSSLHNTRDRDRGKTKVSEEEKQRRLKEMMQDAEAHEDERWTRVKKDKELEEKENKEMLEVKEKRTFLDDMNKMVYDGSEISVEERMKRNKHYIQRRPADDQFIR